MSVTAEQIEAARTSKGGWSKDTLAAWGVAWPPPKGWKSTLTGGHNMRRRRAGIDTDQKIADLVEAGAREAADAVRDAYKWGAEKCESPIEKLLLAQFVHPHTGQEWDMQTHILLPPSGAIENVLPPPIEGIWLWPQIKVGAYRVDFIAATTRASGGFQPSYAVIECDGHDFHERTKEQAQRDKARDRFLTGRGLRVLRYTGSEIYADPAKVWDEIIKVLMGLCD